MNKDVEQFISEMETETLIRENSSKWEKWEMENNRYLILGLNYLRLIFYHISRIFYLVPKLIFLF